MKQNTREISLLFKRIGQKLIYLSGSHVDDIVRTRDLKFYTKSISATNKAFEINDYKVNKLKFIGSKVDAKKRNKISVSKRIDPKT